jgi:hypothetical protein
VPYCPTPRGLAFEEIGPVVERPRVFGHLHEHESGLFVDRHDAAQATAKVVGAMAEVERRPDVDVLAYDGLGPRH